MGNFMRNQFKLKPLIVAISFAGVLAACDGDSNTELASLGSVAPNSGTGTSAPSAPSGPTTSTTCADGNGFALETLATGTACIIEGTLTENTTLSASSTYLLKGKVMVGEPHNSAGTGGTPVNLNIPAGTTLIGDTTQGSVVSYLVVNRGSKINALGTATNPITFTSRADIETGRSENLFDDFTGEWGGIVINGLARLNESPATAGTDCASASGDEICVKTGEGDSGEYGGADDTDSSGTLRYVVVKYAGYPFSGTDELNGIAFQGVGNGTTVEYVQVHNGADDGVEFFGGSVNAKYLVVTGADDDSIDWTQGWTGSLQYAVVVTNPNQITDFCIEGEDGSAVPTGGSTPSPLTYPKVSNLTCYSDGNSAFTGDGPGVAIQYKKDSSGVLVNSVLAGYPFCLAIDDDDIVGYETSASTTDDLIVKNNLWSCDANVIAQGADNNATQFAYETSILDNTEANASGNVVGANTIFNRFINGSVESNIAPVNPTTYSSFFDNPTHIGAVSGTGSTNNWTTGWTYGLNPTPACPSGTTTESDGSCTISAPAGGGAITDDITLVAGLDYNLSGKVVFGEDCGPDVANPLTTCDPADLTIEPGITIKSAGTPLSYIVIARGSKININGTASAPVVFDMASNVTTNIDTSSSLWGGIVINGRARLNESPATAGTNCATATGAEICQKTGEGDSGSYGGNDDTDDSGQIYYTVLKFPGFAFSGTDELNGIAFQGVGNGTEVDYVQVHNAGDDGVEFFGGSVNAKHIVITGSDDDSIDWTQGWTGKMQHVIVVTNSNQSNTDFCIEGEDGSAFPTGATQPSPLTRPMVSNLTCFSAAHPGNGDGSGMAIQFKKDSSGVLINSVIAGYPECFAVDDNDIVAYETDADATNDLIVKSNLWDCPALINAGNPQAAYETSILDNSETNAANNVDDQTNTLTGVGANAATKKYISGDEEGDVTVTDPTTYSTFFDSVTHIGAVKNNAENWTAGWTIYLNE